MHVGLFPKRAQAAVDAVAPAIKASLPSGSAVVYDLTTGQRVAVAGVYDATISRDLALSIPGVLRGLTLKCTTVAKMDLERVAPDGTRLDPGWLEQPEATRPRFATINSLAFDLELSGRAFLRVLRRLPSGEPALGGCEYLALSRVADLDVQKMVDGRMVVERTITVDGIPADPRDVIAFEGYHDGILKHGARTLRTILALDAAARRYADNPLPLAVLINEGDEDLDDDEIDDLLAEWKASRNQEAVGYLNKSVKLMTIGWDPQSMQLVEARQYGATQIAALVGVPAFMIPGAQAADGGSVYANVGQENQALIDYGADFTACAIEARLSMSDVRGSAWDNQVTPRGTKARFKRKDLLQGSPLERAQVNAIYIDKGVLDPDEVRADEDWSPRGGRNER